MVASILGVGCMWVTSDWRLGTFAAGAWLVVSWLAEETV
jgi:hypothetical protein